MHEDDIERSRELWGQLGTIVRDKVSSIANAPIMVNAASIGRKKIAINDGLTTLLHHLKIRDERDVQQHVALEDNGTRRLTERRVDAGAARIRCILQRNIHEMFDSVDAGRRSQ